MAKHLTKMDIGAIINIIHANGNDKITWDSIRIQSEEVVGKKPTRQSLYSNKAIREAYKSKKATLKFRCSPKHKPSNLTAARDRIA